MKADAIIFDKDGTLLDFDAYWVEVTIKAVKSVLKEIGMDITPLNEILLSFGIKGSVTDIDGIVCKGTYEQMGNAMYAVLKNYGFEGSSEKIIELVVEACNKNADAGIIKPTTPKLKEVLTELKTKGKKLVVVTTDNVQITHKCLETLGIEDLFDKIYTDDGKTPKKPDPYCILDYCSISGFEKQKVVMVGDTMTDINFAKNAGISVISLAHTEETKKRLSPYADEVILDFANLIDIIE